MSNFRATLQWVFDFRKRMNEKRKKRVTKKKFRISWEILNKSGIISLQGECRGEAAAKLTQDK